MWGLKKDEIKQTITPVQHRKQEWYMYDYSLNYTGDICGKTLYFNTSGQKGNAIIWSPQLKAECKLLCD